MERVEELWENEKILSRYFANDSDFIERYYESATGKQLPEWIDDSVVFGSYFCNLDAKLGEFYDGIINLQKRLKNKLLSRKKEENYLPALSQKIERLKVDIETLEKSSSDIISNDFSYSEYQSQIVEYDEQEQYLNQVIDELECEEEELLENIERCDLELKKAVNENELYIKKQKETVKIINQFRHKIKELEECVQAILDHRNRLKKRNKDLINFIEELERAKNENKSNLIKLEEKYCKHEELISNIKVIEEKIQKTQEKQEMSLSKYTEAVKMSEMSMIEINKQRVINKRLSDELSRQNKLVQETASSLSVALKQHEDSIVNSFEQILNDLNNRSDYVLVNTKEIINEKNLILKKYEASLSLNKTLQANSSDSSVYTFIREVEVIKGKLLCSIQDINQTKILNERIEDTITELKARTISISKDGRLSLSSDQSRCENLYSVIESSKESISDLHQQNCKLQIENQELRSKIINLKKETDDSISIQLNDSCKQIIELKAELQSIIDSSQIAIDDLNRACSGLKHNAEKWKYQHIVIMNESKESFDTMKNKEIIIEGEYNSLTSNLESIKKEYNYAKSSLMEHEKQKKLIKEEIKQKSSMMRMRINEIHLLKEFFVSFESKKRSWEEKNHKLGYQISKLKNVLTKEIV